MHLNNFNLFHETLPLDVLLLKHSQDSIELVRQTRKPKDEIQATTIKDFLQIKQKKEIIFIQLKGICFTKQLEDLHQILQETQLKVSLDIDIHFQYTYSIARFLKYMSLVASRIVYLKWNVKNQYTAGPESSYVRDILQQLTELYKLDIVFAKDYLFTQKNILYFLEGIESLKKLMVLKFNLEVINEKNITPFRNIESSKYSPILYSKTIKMFESNIISVDPDSFIFSDLLNVQISYTHYFLDCLKTKYCIIENLKVNTTQISFELGVIKFFNNESKDEEVKILQQFFIQCLDLPYLTQYKTPLQFLNTDLQIYGQILKSLTELRLQTIILIIAYYSYQQQYIPINPKYIITDLWFD